MAGAGKLSLRLSSARELLLYAVFIMLSAYGTESRQCYWCGPLAEQVHRSRRAPLCEGAARHITVCEPGYDYCAIIATSPPYLESRFCVKFYQDECYPLFCNSTKTWKMTCPCRGDLCNGANSEREEDAFSALTRLLAKTHSRIEKRAPSMQLTGNRKGRIVNPEPNDDHLLTGNSVEEEKDTQDNTLKQNGSLTIDNQSSYEKQATELNIGNTPASTYQPIKTRNGESEDSTSINPENGADIQTVIGGKSESENDANIKYSTVGKEIENAKLFSTVMIEIDIIHRSSTFAQHDIKDRTTAPETNFQADEPMQHNYQSEVVNKLSEDESRSEESKPNETTTNLPKLGSSESITTSPPSQIEFSVNSDHKIETSLNVNPSESTSTETVQKIESQPTVGSKSVSEKQNEMSSTGRLGIVATTAYQVTDHTVAASETQSSKIKNNNNNAIKVTISTLISIPCILLSTFSLYAF